jgi:hypothetical protein
MWPAVASLAAFITAVLAGGVGLANYIRVGRQADEDKRLREQTEAAKERSEASQVGLAYMREALGRQQDEIIRLKGEIGEIRGHLESCRELLAGRLADVERKLE